MSEAWVTIFAPSFSLISIVLVCYILRHAAGDREERIRLGFEVWFSLLFVVIVVLLYGYLTLWNGFFKISPENRQMLVRLYPGIICWSYLVLSRLVRTVTDKIFSYEDYQEFFTMKVYRRQVDEEGAQWVVRREFGPYQKEVRYLYLAFLIAALVVFWISITSVSMWNDLIFVVPTAGMIFFETLSLFLDGNLDENREDRFTGEGLDADLKHRYMLAADHLEQMFPQALLYKNVPESFLNRVSPEKILNKLERSGNISDQLAAAWFRSEFPGHSVDPDYIHAAADLLEKKNTLIFNPFHEDLGIYLALPFNESLMDHKKILVLCEGNEEADKICEWLRNILDRQSSFQEKWKVFQLDDLVPDCNVGILSYSRLFDPDVLRKNKEFFEQCEYVLLLEPSEVISTMQMPLSTLAEMLKKGTTPVFCVMDQFYNTLGDTISHVLKSRFESQCVITDQADFQTLMIWDADADFQSIERFEKETGYFGGGIELGAEAVSVQIPEVDWVSKKSLPVLDIQDRAARSFAPITKVMKTEASQSALYNRLRVQPDYWDQPRKKAEFVIVEDESHNPFAAAQNYRSRGEEEVFINVLSEDYLLRDYFCANASVFLTNPSSVKALLPAYAKTRRNLLYKLILKLNIEPATEQELLQELSLAGIEAKDFDEAMVCLERLLSEYTYAKPNIFRLEVRKLPSYITAPEIIREVSIVPEKFEEYFGKTLKNASYILEDEYIDHYRLNSRLYSLIPQILLPGQELTYEGRNYQVKEISPDTGVLLRRAADLADGRKRYQQYRHYNLSNIDDEPEAYQQLNGFEFIRQSADLSVRTFGYLETVTYAGVTRTNKKLFSISDPQDCLNREFRNKTILMIRFPVISQQDLYLTASLLQEVLLTVLPGDHNYLAILAKQPDESSNISQTYFCSQVKSGELVVIEDSDLDLGLLDIFEKYFFTLMDIVKDYLLWNKEKLEAADDSSAKLEDIHLEEISTPEKRDIDTNIDPEELSKKLDKIREEVNAEEVLTDPASEEESQSEENSSKHGNESDQEESDKTASQKEETPDE